MKIQKNGMRMGWVALAAVTAAMVAGVSQADDLGDNVPQQKVVYKDLNLKSDAGIQVLYRRIQGAANQVCGKVDEHDLAGMLVRKTCVEKAVSDAVSSVDSPMLKRAYIAKTGSAARQMVTVAQVR